MGHARGAEAVHRALARLQSAPDPSLGFAEPGGITVACCALSGTSASAEHAAAGGSWRAGVRRPYGLAMTMLAPAETVGTTGESCACPAGPGGKLQLAGGRLGWRSRQQPDAGPAAGPGSPLSAQRNGAPAVAAAGLNWVAGEPAPTGGAAGVPAHGDTLAGDPLEGIAAEAHPQLQPRALQRVWAQAVPDACHLRVADGVAAVACNSGVLLLLDATIGALIRCALATGSTSPRAGFILSLCFSWTVLCCIKLVLLSKGVPSNQRAA